METKIYKYKLEVACIQIIRMPQGSNILCVKTQHDEAYIWAMVNPSYDSEDVQIEIFGTGQSIYNSMGIMREYIGTFQIDDNGKNYVFHVFKRIS